MALENYSKNGVTGGKTRGNPDEEREKKSELQSVTLRINDLEKKGREKKK